MIAHLRMEDSVLGTMRLVVVMNLIGQSAVDQLQVAVQVHPWIIMEIKQVKLFV